MGARVEGDLEATEAAVQATGTHGYQMKQDRVLKRVRLIRLLVVGGVYPVYRFTDDTHADISSEICSVRHG